MNNIFVNQDPLLYNQKSHQQEPIMPPYEYYRLYQQQAQQTRDWVGELNQKMKSLDNNTINELNNNQIYLDLSSSLQGVIQNEIMNLIKNNLNSNIEVVDNIKKQLNLMSEVESKTKEIERQNISELNDYMNNYSNMSFDEYKKIKNTGISVQDKKKTTK